MNCRCCECDYFAAHTLIEAISVIEFIVLAVQHWRKIFTHQALFVFGYETENSYLGEG